MTRIGVVGPSHLGIVWSTVLAEKGNKVIYLKSARFDVHEPGLKELIDRNIKNGNLEYDNSYSRLKECDVVFLSWDTPTDKYNNIQLDLLNRVIAAIIPNLNETAIFVVMSQVPPGFMRSIDFPKDRLFHQVDTLVFGESIERAAKPRIMVIGTNDGLFDTELESVWNYRYWDLVHMFNCPKVFITYEEAEIFKLAMNANLAAQISVTNTMAELCDHYNANWSRIADCLKYDLRVGTYTKPGLGIGGGHLERDLNTIQVLSRKHGFNSDIIGASISSSKYMQYSVLRELENNFGSTEFLHIAIWGLSYKEDTNSIKDSPAITTIDALDKCKVWAHDPQVSITRENLTMVKDPLDALPSADALLIMTPHEEYKKFKRREIIIRLNAEGIIIDPYYILGS